MTRGRNVSYPLAEACLHRLLGTSTLPDAEADTARSENEKGQVQADVQPFLIGPAVMRAPPDLARPPSERAAPADEGGASSPGHTDALLEDLVDVLLVGEDSGKPEVHLSFKPEVFGGLYLRLERRDEGLFAHFSVPDDHARRSVQGHIDDLLARLSSAGFSICGSSLQVQENP
jgi:flagellar hook-length control protein FliK